MIELNWFENVYQTDFHVRILAFITLNRPTLSRKDMVPSLKCQFGRHRLSCLSTKSTITTDEVTVCLVVSMSCPFVRNYLANWPIIIIRGQFSQQQSNDINQKTKQKIINQFQLKTKCWVEFDQIILIFRVRAAHTQTHTHNKTIHSLIDHLPSLFCD